MHLLQEMLAGIGGDQEGKTLEFSSPRALELLPRMAVMGCSMETLAKNEMIYFSRAVTPLPVSTSMDRVQRAGGADHMRWNRGEPNLTEISATDVVLPRFVPKLRAKAKQGRRMQEGPRPIKGRRDPDPVIPGLVER